MHGAWCDWSLTWLTNHRSSVVLHCCLGHVTREIVSEMTYNVSSGMLNSAVPSADTYVGAIFVSNVQLVGNVFHGEIVLS